MKSLAGIASGLALLGVSGLASGVVLFQDNFDSETGGLNQPLSQWTHVVGATDTVSLGGHGLACAAPGGSGLCVDLDGSTGVAATIESNTLFNLTAGVTYVLSYDISGNQRGGSDTLDVELGTATATHTLNSTDAFDNFTLSLTPAADTSVRIVFEHAGGDNVGIILDNVLLQSVDQPPPGGAPEPGSLALLGLGLAALGLGRRRFVPGS